MITHEPLTLFHAPQSRSSGVLTLLEELRLPYELNLVNMKAGEQRQSAYLAVNPMGKVPALLHGDALVTEQVAIYLYLADLAPKADLAPPIGYRLRGPYLRWLAFYGACYEPALVDRAMKREPAPPSMTPYSDFDTMLNTLVEQLAGGPYLLGDTVCAADILWGTALQWGLMFGIIPQHPVITAYVKRMAARPSFARVAAMDVQWAAEHAQAAQALQGADAAEPVTL